MTVIIDTQLLLWATIEPERLPGPATEILMDSSVARSFSAASIWEVAIKSALGRADFDVDPRELRTTLLRHGLTEVAIDGRHAAAVIDLPLIHADPFDRLLIAQAKVERVPLLTSDAKLAGYGPSVQMV
ncbi:MAG: type II toxin-antitoxin system VapC family toxin [Trueperaceae bacterium]|nr:type II toxin-antitoxin system VapC family toxin [Trueperaceae bacterium]